LKHAFGCVSYVALQFAYWLALSFASALSLFLPDTDYVSHYRHSILVCSAIAAIASTLVFHRLFSCTRCIFEFLCVAMPPCPFLALGCIFVFLCSCNVFSSCSCGSFGALCNSRTRASCLPSRNSGGSCAHFPAHQSCLSTAATSSGGLQKCREKCRNAVKRSLAPGFSCGMFPRGARVY